MTAQRRSRRHSPDPDPQDRLRALGLDSSPTARRLRARIPRPRPSKHATIAVDSDRAPVQAAEAPRVRAGEVPSAPYAIETTTPYRPAVPRKPGSPAHRKTTAPAHAITRVTARASAGTPASAWPERDPDDTLALAGRPGKGRGSDGSGGRAGHREHDGHPDREASGGRRGRAGTTGRRTGSTEEVLAPVVQRGGNGSDEPARTPTAPYRSAPSAREEPGPGPWRPDGDLTAKEGEEEEKARRRRPPSGYTEFDEEADPWSERITRLLGPNVALSRKAVLVLLVLGLLAVVGALLVLRDDPETVTVSEAEPQAAAESGEEAAHGAEEGEEGGTGPEGDGAGPEPRDEVVVHVGGEVADPGLYTMPPGSRVSDAVDEAGGPLADADLDLLNLARPLEDGEQILVGVPEAGGGGDTDGEHQQAGSDLVNVNRADAELLETLPGIGEAIAGNIIDHREEHGPFGSVDDLIDVNRIGEKVLEDLEPLVTVG